MPELRTDRLRLRPFRPDDAGDFIAMAGDPAVARMTSDIPSTLSEADAGPWLRPEPGEARFAIEHQGRLIGGAGYFLRSSGTGELGFWIARPMWGQGFATEAGRAVVQHGFTAGNLGALSSSHFTDNPASGRVLVKLGFEPVGRGSMWCVSRKSTVETVEYWKPREVRRKRESRASWLSLFAKVRSSA